MSKINLKHTIFYKHIAILGFLRPHYHHAMAKEAHFTFLHLHKNNNLFKIIYQAINELNQSFKHTASNDHDIYTIAHA